VSFSESNIARESFFLSGEVEREVFAFFLFSSFDRLARSQLARLCSITSKTMRTFLRSHVDKQEKTEKISTRFTARSD
jgi:hypothetical protein